MGMYYNVVIIKGKRHHRALIEGFNLDYINLHQLDEILKSIGCKYVCINNKDVVPIENLTTFLKLYIPPKEGRFPVVDLDEFSINKLKMEKDIFYRVIEKYIKNSYSHKQVLFFTKKHGLLTGFEILNKKIKKINFMMLWVCLGTLIKIIYL